eukprot:10243464-Karenia_brevis.AAC.1
MGWLNLVDFTSSKLEEYKSSYITDLNKKPEAKSYLLGDRFDSLNLESKSKDKMRQVFASYETVRKDLTPYDADSVDISWQ